MKSNPGSATAYSGLASVLSKHQAAALSMHVHGTLGDCSTQLYSMHLWEWSQCCRNASLV